MTLSRTTVLAVCLAASLIGNVVLAGMAASRRTVRMEAPVVIPQVMRVVRAVPPEQQKPLLDIVRPAQAALREKQQAQQQQRQRITELMAANPIDKAQLQEAYAGLRNINGEIQAINHSALIETIMLLPPDLRQRVMAPPPPPRRGPGGQRPPQMRQWPSLQPQPKQSVPAQPNVP